MRSPVALLGAVLLVAAGCATTATVTPGTGSFVADQVPVVSVVTERGLATGWLRDDGSIVTVSHVIPRAQPTGAAEVSTVPGAYTVLASGDDLAEVWDTAWKCADPAVPRSGQLRDWAILSHSAGLTPTDIYPMCLDLGVDAKAPIIGERLLLVGYTREDGELIRYWVDVEVCPAPERVHATGNHVWFATSNRSKLRQGFSGAPLLRRRDDGTYQAVAMMVGAERRSGIPLDRGVAIPLP